MNAFLLGHLAALSDLYQVTLCVNLDLYPLSEKIDPRVSVCNIPLVRKISVLQDFRALIHLIRVFGRGRFDVVHSMTPKAGLLSMFAARLCRVPYRFHTFTGQVWATRTGTSRAFFKWIDRCIVRCSTRVFTDSDSQSRFIEREGIAKHGAVTVLGHGAIMGVDQDRFKPDTELRKKIRLSLGCSERSCVFLFVGRIARDKGVFDLMEAFSRLASERDDVALWMVGPDEEGLQNELQQHTAEIGEKIRWLGRTFEPEHFMAAADALVLPSYREGFGMVIIEAAGCAVPTLAYRIDGVIDAVVDGETGVLVSARDVVAFGDIMRAMAGDPAWVRKLGQGALLRVGRDFSERSVREAWLNFYKGILE